MNIFCKKDYLFKLSYLFLLLTLVTGLLVGCTGKSKYVGTWYDINDPDSRPLIITEDKIFSIDGVGGTVSEIDNGLLLLATSGGSGTETIKFDKYDGSFALVSEDGDIYISDYNKAVRIRNKAEEERRKAEEEERLAREKEEKEREEKRQSAPLVIDNADILTNDEESQIETGLQKFREEQNFDIVVLTVYSLDGKDVVDYADEYYDNNLYGGGEYRDGALILVSTENRDWTMITTGFGITVLTDEILDDIEEIVLTDLSAGNFASAFENFADQVAYYVREARK